MALVVRDSDTTTTDGTEQTLGAAQTFAGVYVVQVDLSALQRTVGTDRAYPWSINSV